VVIVLCEFCKKKLIIFSRKKRFCNALCQRKHYNRRPKIREKNRLRMKEYRKDNPEWREKHRILQAKYKEKRKVYQKQYWKRKEVKIRVSEKRKWRLKNDPEFAIKDRLKRSLNHALTKYSNTGKIMSSKKYGINWKDIIGCLKPFPKKMEDYEIDHIVPLRVFNLTNPEEVKIAFSPKNLRWLTKQENRKKGGKIVS
jgi:hypothetical protein